MLPTNDSMTEKVFLTTSHFFIIPPSIDGRQCRRQETVFSGGRITLSFSKELGTVFVPTQGINLGL